MVGVIFFDADGTLIDCNNAFLKMAGYERSDVDNKLLHWKTLTPPEWLAASERQMSLLEQTGSIGPYEKEYFHKDGTRSWMLFSGRLLADGTVAEFVIDINDRKQTEEELRGNQQRQNFLLTLSDALRPLSRPLDIQETAARVLGQYLQAVRVVYVEVTATEYMIERDYVNGVTSMAGRYPVHAFGPGKLAEYVDGKTRVISDTRSDQYNSSADAVNFEAIGVRAGIGVPLVKDGRFMMALVVQMNTPRNWTKTEVALVEETAERTWAAVERAKAEAALRDSELTRQIALEAFHIGMATWYPQDDHLDADDRFFELFGLQASDSVNREIGRKRLVHPDDKEHHASMIDKALDPAGGRQAV
jgi:PAS domain S-box-containing protein